MPHGALWRNARYENPNGLDPYTNRLGSPRRKGNLSGRVPAFVDSARRYAWKPLEITRRRVVFLMLYGIALVGAELLLLLATSTGAAAFAVAGLIIDAALIVGLPIEASFLVSKDPPLAAFLGTLVLPPVIRIVALAIPSAFFTPVEWLAVTGLPLLLASGAVMRAQGLHRRDVYLGIGDRRFLPLQVTIAFLGLGIGFAEYQILRPLAWISASDVAQIPFAFFAIFLTNGLAEELIFRGILLRAGAQLLGRTRGIVYVTFIFTSMHIGFGSPRELALVFFTGLLFGAVVLITKSLLGVVGAHTLANAVEYLVLPFGL